MAMGMNTGGVGGRGKVAPYMNVTPLVDIVLVLLIIFMVVTPLLTKKFWIHTPKQEKKEVEKQELNDEPEPPLVLRVAADRTISVNGAQVGFEELSGRLRRFFAAREDHILFFDAANEVPYGYSVQVMDQARAGGAVTIAALTSALQSSAAPAAAVPAP